MKHVQLEIRTYSVILVFLLYLLACASLSFADDGGLAYGGSPRLLKGHPTVTMLRELIQITVSKESFLKADCLFVFTNNGPACSVRMGFPDEGDAASDPDKDYDGDNVLKTPPKTTFESFVSYVQGSKVATRLIRANESGHYWHTKTVKFPAHASIEVRDVYTQYGGGGVAVCGGQVASAMQIGYILHTGASWHGNIGRCEVVVTFKSDSMPKTLKAVPIGKVSYDSDGRYLKIGIPSKNVVVWKGPCPPSVNGRTLRFVRQNFRPREKDDIELTYGYEVSR